MVVQVRGHRVGGWLGWEKGEGGGPEGEGPAAQGTNVAWISRPWNLLPAHPQPR